MKTPPLVCKRGWVGHKWSEIPPRPGFAVWCVRCHVMHPRWGFDYHETKNALASEDEQEHS